MTHAERSKVAESFMYGMLSLKFPHCTNICEISEFLASLKKLILQTEFLNIILKMKNNTVNESYE